jgi:hypothetical protein
MVTIIREVQVLVASILLFTSILIAGTLRFKGVIKGSFLISTVHAVSILILTSLILFSECWETVSHYCRFDATSNSDFQQFTLLVSMGYFFVDSVVVLWFAPDASAALHHVSILLGQAATIFYGDFDPSPLHRHFHFQGVSGYPLACFLFGAEISAPFLNAFLSGFARKDSGFEFFAKAMFAFTFIVSRLVICPFLTYEFVVNTPNAPWAPRLVCVFVMGISLYWSKAIIAGVIDAVQPASSSKKELLTEEAQRLKGE